MPHSTSAYPRRHALLSGGFCNRHSQGNARSEYHLFRHCGNAVILTSLRNLPSTNLCAISCCTATTVGGIWSPASHRVDLRRPFPVSPLLMATPEGRCSRARVAQRSALGVLVSEWRVAISGRIHPQRGRESSDIISRSCCPSSDIIRTGALSDRVRRQAGGYRQLLNRRPGAHAAARAPRARVPDHK